MNHETFRSTIEEIKNTQAEATKRGAIWAVNPNGTKRPLGEALSLLTNLRSVLHSGIPGRIESPITHDVQNSKNGPRVVIEEPRPDGDIPAWKQGSYKRWIR